MKKQQTIQDRLKEVLRDEEVSVEIIKILDNLIINMKNNKIDNLESLFNELLERSLFIYIKGYEEGIK